MKNKLVKSNMTGFDYKARKLGIIGGVIIILSLAILLPITSSVSRQNVSLANEVYELNQEIKDTDAKYIVEKK